jgi:hypothetical protein
MLGFGFFNVLEAFPAAGGGGDSCLSGDKDDAGNGSASDIDQNLRNDWAMGRRGSRIVTGAYLLNAVCFCDLR